MSSDDRYYRLAMRLFADFSFAIAIPAIIGAVLGKRLDELYDTSPRYLLICLAIALLLTAMVIAKKAKKYGREYAKLIEESSKKPEKEI